MILSKLHKFAFIKGRKVAGTSVEIALSKICGPDDIITPITPPGDERRRLELGGRSAQNYSQDPHAERAYIESVSRAADISDVQMPTGDFTNHMPLKRLAKRFEPVQSGYDVIAIDRNPYSKVLSLANMRSAKAYRADMYETDDRDLRAEIDQLLAGDELTFIQNIRLYKWMSGAVGARIMRYETLEEDFDRFVRGLGITDVPEIPHVKKGRLSDQMNPLDFFTKAQIAKINEVFAEEFHYYGYTSLTGQA